MSGTYARAARAYLRAGWTCPLPLPPAAKEPPPAGYTGRDARLVGVKDLERWTATQPDGNVALRLLGSMIGIDVDAYAPKAGARTLCRAELELGALPPTWRSSARTDDGVSGIRFYRLPTGVTLGAEAERRLSEAFGEACADDPHGWVSHVEIIRPDHRYAIVWPSVHPDTLGIYRWWGPDGQAAPDDVVPEAREIPDLPQLWVAFLAGDRRLGGRTEAGRSAPERPQSVDGVGDDTGNAGTGGSSTGDDGSSPFEGDDEDGGDDEFDTPGASERSFSKAEAEGIIKATLATVRNARRGAINDTLNKEAFYLGHFVPVFSDAKTLARALLDAQRDAWVASGGADDGDYRKAKDTIRRAFASAAKPGQWLAVEDDAGGDPLAAIALAGGGGQEGSGAENDEASEEQRSSTKSSGVFFTDAAFSEHVASAVLASRFVHVERLGWMAWERAGGKGSGAGRWVDTDDTGPIEAVRRYCLAMLRRAVAKVAKLSGDEDANAAECKQAEALADAWRTLCSRSRLTAITSLTVGQKGVRVRVGDLDADPDLLNTPSGVVDLRTGEVRPARPEDLMTRITRAPYRGADHESEYWTKAVQAIPDDVRDWIQVFMGQACTGHLNTEDRLLLLDGDGKNGKGVLTNEGAVWTLGDYALLVPETILLSAKSVHPTEFMTLRGVRLALIDETPEARVLDTQRLKKIIGQPAMTARELYQKNVTFTLRHTMVVATNHLPRVTETDHGTWRRLTRLRMPYTFRTGAEAIRGPGDRQGDPDLKAMLKLEPDVQAACLAWLVRGAMKWYASGRHQADMPARVAADTGGWRSEGDPLQMFINEHLEFAPGAHVISRELWAHFNRWLEERGHKAWADRTFSERLAQHHLVLDQGGRVEHQRIRAGGIHGPASRPPHIAAGNALDVPGQYTAWLGVRYAESASGGDEFDSPAAPS